MSHQPIVLFIYPHSLLVLLLWRTLTNTQLFQVNPVLTLCNVTLTILNCFPERSSLYVQVGPQDTFCKRFGSSGQIDFTCRWQSWGFAGVVGAEETGPGAAHIPCCYLLTHLTGVEQQLSLQLSHLPLDPSLASLTHEPSVWLALWQKTPAGNLHHWSWKQ